MTLILKYIIIIYRYAISPVLPPTCRFQPTCSEYALQSLEKNGLKAILPSVKRLLCCHPFHPGGYDPPN